MGTIESYSEYLKSYYPKKTESEKEKEKEKTEQYENKLYSSMSIDDKKKLLREMKKSLSL